MTAHATKLRRMGEGLCYGCGECPPAEGKLQCDGCLERQKAMWAAWREKTGAIEREEAAIRAEALKSGEVGAGTADPGGQVIPGVGLAVTNKNVVRVCDAHGRPILAIVPWESYRDLLVKSVGGKRRRGRPVRRDIDLVPRTRAVGAGRPRLSGAHVLRELIRKHPDLSGAEIGRLFCDQTGLKVNRNTVNRYRRDAQERRARGLDDPESAPPPAEGRPGLVVGGVDLGEYDAVVVEVAIRAGASPASARESEEYADGLVALYEAAEDFDLSAGDGRFLDYATRRIRRGIAQGREDRKVKVRGKSGRVLNFSEIGDEDFDISELIDDSGRLS